MKHRHIAVFTNPANAHIYPVLGLCSELVKRGHRVTYATTAHYAPQVSRTGAEPVIFNPVRLENADPVFQMPSFYNRHFWTVYASILGPLGLIHAASALHQVESYYRDNLPDLILDDRLYFLGRMLAARLSCSVIQLIPTFAFYDNFILREDGNFTNPEPMLAFSKVLDCFLEAYGINDRNNLWHVADLNISFVTREFQFHGESFDERYCFVGPCLNRPVRSEWKNNSAGRPIVLVSGSQLGAGADYFRTIIEAFSSSKFFVVLSPGANISEDSLGPLPDNCEINRDAFNFQILPHATLAISQGGTNMVLECLYYGVPVLIVPRSPVHEEVAYRVAELGLGSYIPEEMMSVDTIKEGVDQVLGDAELAGRIVRMQQTVRSSGGAEMAANRIEQFLEGSATL